MTPTPAFHPHILERSPDRAQTLKIGEAVPYGGVKVEHVPCSVYYDPNEARTYNGVKTSVLSEHAKDIYAVEHHQVRRPGDSKRFFERAYDAANDGLQIAIRAYVMVKNALRLLATPLQNKVERRKSRPEHPRAPKIWVTKPPTAKEWNARDIKAGYDIRGTSPTWVMRRVYKYRIQRRRALEPVHERAFRLGQEARKPAPDRASFIGPPEPRHYKEVDDLHQIWPPIDLPARPKGMLPKVADISEKESIEPADPAHVDNLIEAYNFALEQFGEDGTFNYLRSLPEKDADILNPMINQHRARVRTADPKERAPP